jgi:KipI family sensor histidine kinase inhibitor
MRLLPYGDRAVLIETPTPLALAAALRGQLGMTEVVPAARTVLVRLDESVMDPRASIAAVVRGHTATPPPDSTTPHVELAVRYDGVDLDAVATEVGLSVQALVARHSAATYTVAFCGFAPGFAYLTGLDPALVVPRLAQPRTTVPAGAVGIAGEFTGVYPRSSPGGWRLLGGTGADLWDATRTPPALLTPGTTVRFTPA